jgi:serine/threonine protein kinase
MLTRQLSQDLKADNILVEEFGHCKITDFGISKRTDDINMIGAHTSMQGSVFWMAPEVINSKKKGYNSKIDIWSVGCVVFEMWTGERPWSGQEVVAVLLQVCIRLAASVVIAESPSLALPIQSRPSIARGYCFVSSGR